MPYRIAKVGEVRKRDRAVVVNAVAVKPIRRVEAKTERLRRCTCLHRLEVPHERHPDQGDDDDTDTGNQPLRHDAIFADVVTRLPSSDIPAHWPQPTETHPAILDAMRVEQVDPRDTDWETGSTVDYRVIVSESSARA